MSLLVAHELVVRIAGRALLNGIELGMDAGEVVLLGGRNGAGKTTLLHALAGLRKIEAGEVLLEGRAISAWPARQRARTIALVPQDDESPFQFTGRELVLMGRHPHIPRFALPGLRDHQVVHEALAAVDAIAFADRPLPTLSGGERRRIAIARALATESKVILLDEPTASLDLEHALLVLDLLTRLARQGRSVLMTSHEIGLAATRADRVALLHEGRIVCDAPPREALDDARLVQVFGVDRRAMKSIFDGQEPNIAQRSTP